MLRRVAKVAIGIIAAWLVVLGVLDFAFGARQERRTKERLAESLRATVTIETSDLALIRGQWHFEKLAIRRDDVVGHLAIDVAEVRCELGPLGWALVDHDCSELALRGGRLEVSTAALFKVPHPKRRPIHTDRLLIDDAQLVFMPSAFAPNLGRVAITIEHAEAGPTIMRTPLSWLFSLRELQAKLELPNDIQLALAFHAGRLSVSSPLFGVQPVEVPVAFPDPSVAADGHAETQMLVETGKQIAEQLVVQRAADWVKGTLTQPR